MSSRDWLAQIVLALILSSEASWYVVNQMFGFCHLASWKIKRWWQMWMESFGAFMSEMYWLSQQGPRLLFQYFSFLICINFDCSNVLSGVAIGNPPIAEMCSTRTWSKLLRITSLCMTGIIPKERNDAVITAPFTLALIILWVFFFLQSIHSLCSFNWDTPLLLEWRRKFRQLNVFLCGCKQQGPIYGNNFTQRKYIGGKKILPMKWV